MLAGLCATGSSLIAPHSALAQSSLYGAALVGQSAPNDGEVQEKIVIEPNVSASWDSNILRRNPDVFSGTTANTRVSPSLNLGLNRQFGRTRLQVAAALGYDFNSNFKFLNQERLSASAGAQLPVGSECPVSVRGTYQQLQYDFNDTDRIARTPQKRTSISVDLMCSRPGLSPNFGASLLINNNAATSITNTRYFEAHGGISLGVPSIGSVTLAAQRARITRPNFRTASGIADHTDITRMYLAFDRSVAPRFSLSGKVGYAKAEPSRRGVPVSSSLFVDGQVSYDVTPRFKLSLRGLQDVQESTGISATYVRMKQIRAALNTDLFNATSVSVSLSKMWRAFEGNDALTGPAVGSDQIDALSVGINRTVGRRLTLGVVGSLQKRDADASFYDYASRSAALSLGAKF